MTTLMLLLVLGCLAIPLLMLAWFLFCLALEALPYVVGALVCLWMFHHLF